MSAASRQTAFAQAVAADIKALKATPAVPKPDRLADMLADGIIYAAHRGGGAAYPENSLQGFYASARAGFMLENDVRATSDGRLIIMHDANLDRTTNLTGAVNTKTLAQIKKGYIDPVHPGLSPQPIPTWIEYLEMCRDTGCTSLVEIKDALPATLSTMIKDMKDRGMEKQLLPCSFVDTEAIAFAQAGFQASYITGDNTTNWQSLWDQGVRWCSINIVNFTAAQVAAIKAIGFKPLAWTPNTWADGQAAIAKGCTGVITDDPWLLSERQNITANLALDGSIPSHFSRRQTNDDSMVIGDLTVDGYRFAGNNILARRGTSANNIVQAVDLGFVPRPNPTIRFSARFLPGAVDQTTWLGVAWGQTQDPDTNFDDTATTAGQQGYTIILRRTGELQIYAKVNGTTPQIGTTGVPTPNVTTATTGTSAWQDIEIRFTATNVTIENRTTGLSVTVTEAAWRGNGRPFLISKGTDHEHNLAGFAFA